MKDEIRVAGPEDYERIVAIVDDWWGQPISDKLPRLYLDHFWSTSRVAEDASGLAGFLVAAFEKRKRAVHDLIAGTIVVQAQITTD